MLGVPHAYCETKAIPIGFLVVAWLANVRFSDIAESDCHVRFVPHACKHWVEAQRLPCRPSARPVATACTSFYKLRATMEKHHARDLWLRRACRSAVGVHQ
jgi:hypothetical protein